MCISFIIKAGILFINLETLANVFGSLEVFDKVTDNHHSRLASAEIAADCLATSASLDACF